MQRTLPRLRLHVISDAARLPGARYRRTTFEMIDILVRRNALIFTGPFFDEHNF
jgi:hypothetical protein